MNSPAILFRVSFVCLLLALLAGCSSMNQPASSSFASVIITNTTPADIRATTIEVFKESDFHSAYANQQDMLVFEREATRGQSIAYNGFVATHYGEVSLNRVKTKLYDRGNGSYRLSCQAYIVTDAGSFTGGNEVRLGNTRSGPYQKILDEIAGRLNPPTK